MDFYSPPLARVTSRPRNRRGAERVPARPGCCPSLDDAPRSGTELACHGPLGVQDHLVFLSVISPPVIA